MVLVGRGGYARGMLQLIFYTVLALLFTHEMDAVRHYEWRLLPILRNRSEKVGADLFVVLHIPLFALFIWLGAHPYEGLRTGFQIAVDLFAIIHIWLHHLFRNHPEYRFQQPLSRFYIWGSGVVGLLHLILLNLV